MLHVDTANMINTIAARLLKLRRSLSIRVPFAQGRIVLTGDDSQVGGGSGRVVLAADQRMLDSVYCAYSY